MKVVIKIEGYIGNIPRTDEGDITPRFSFVELASRVKEAKEAGATGLEFVIDSYGGYINEGFLIAEYIESLAEPTTMVAVCVHSIANVIFFAGDERIGNEESEFMLHGALVAAQGNAEQLRDVADLLDRESERIASYIAMRSGLDLQAVKGLMGEDRYINNEEASRLGFYGTAKKVLAAAYTAKNKNHKKMQEEQKEKLTAWQILGQKLGLLNMEDEQKEPTKKEEEEDKDAIIADLRAKLSEMAAQMQAMQEKHQAMEQEKAEGMEEFTNLSKDVQAILKDLEEAKRRTSNATPPSSHQRFNQTRKPEPAKTGEKDRELVGAAKFIAKRQNDK